jgi:hypothetical protein
MDSLVFMQRAVAFVVYAVFSVHMVLVVEISPSVYTGHLALITTRLAQDYNNIHIASP